MTKQIQLAIAPIAWTNDDMPELGSENTFEQCISEMALDPEVLEQYLNIRGLKVASAWFSAFLTTKPFEETAEAFKAHRDFLHAMGAKVIVVAEQGHSIQGIMTAPVFDDKPVFTDEEWKKLAEGLEKLGDLAHEKDMEIVYHHHMGTGVQTTEEIDRLMEMTDPDKVKLLFDTGHLVFSGENPIAVYNRHQDRIKGVFTVPGDGMIDFTPIWTAIHASDYEGWIVVEAEQDPAKANPFEYAVKARSYIREVTGL